MTGAGSRSIESHIKELIVNSGSITFEKFMELALYGSGDLYGDGGYYSGGSAVWGAGGDYVTNIDISDTFAVMLGKCFFEMWQGLGSPKTFTILEAGAGRGTLTLEVVKSISVKSKVDETYESFLNTLSVVLVDRGGAFKDSAVELTNLLDKPVKTYQDIKEVSEPFVGVIYSNELFDAMPVHVLKNDGGLKEVHVDFKESKFVEVLKDLSYDRLISYLDRLDIKIPEGSKCEVNLHMEGFIKEASRLIKKGYLLTVDYGYPAKVLYDKSRTGGTLLCHYKHKVNDDPYSNVGEQDITAHIDFTTLAVVGSEAGLDVVGFTTQSGFLLGLGVTGEFEALMEMDKPSAEAIKRNQAIKELVLPGGVGDIFKVMIQSKLARDVSDLSCFSFKNLKYKLF